ncbi:MAG: hypothetical protein KDB74_11655 [Flavobacteriales bacterium]|nr:hypothetical protein [Flavobacteriales bacterium]
MKKSILACIFTAFFCTLAISQNLKKDIELKFGPAFKINKKTNLLDIIPLDNGEFITIEVYGRSGNGDFEFIHFNTNMQELNRGRIELKVDDEMHRYEQLIYENGDLYLFTSLGNSKEDYSRLYFQKIDLKTLSTNKIIAQVDEAYSKKGYSPFSLTFSPDKSKMLVYKVNSGDRKEKISYGVKVLDVTSNFTELWKQDLESDYSDELEDIEKIRVSNEGDIYLLSIQYKEKRRAKKDGEANYIYMLKEYSKDGDRVNQFPISLQGEFITDMTIGLNGNNEIVCTGFYSTIGTYGIKGCYYMLLDAKTKTIKKESKKEFSFDFLTANLSERKTKKAEKRKEKGKDIELANYILGDIVLREDGGVIQVAECYYITSTTYTDGNGMRHTSYQHHFDDLIVISISPSGNIDWTRKIRKSQTAPDSYNKYASYHLKVNGDKMYFFHNGNAENLLLGEKEAVKGWTLGKKGCGIITEITSEGYMRNDIFIDVAGYGLITYIRNSTNFDNNEVMFFGSYKKTNKYFKVILPED